MDYILPVHLKHFKKKFLLKKNILVENKLRQSKKMFFFYFFTLNRSPGGGWFLPLTKRRLGVRNIKLNESYSGGKIVVKQFSSNKKAHR